MRRSYVYGATTADARRRHDDPDARARYIGVGRVSTGGNGCGETQGARLSLIVKALSRGTLAPPRFKNLE